MTAPALAGPRLLAAVLLGAAAGVWYGFLRPLRRPWLRDLLFLPVLGYGWLYHSFGLCGGDIRMGSLAAMLLGAALADTAAGPFFPIFAGFWHLAAGIIGIFTLPGKIFLKNTKFFVASVKKMVTIKWSNRRDRNSAAGGADHGKAAKPFQKCSPGP